ncbi:hypothetical protein L218DRAFT_1007889 [Marasmius fiardii PR-910]|nr:hypothetical protein L218DRAFT_1007889 [Marasmius fiardii PR-910]
MLSVGAIVTGIMDAAVSMNDTLGIDSYWVNLLDNISNSFVACIALVNFGLTAAIGKYFAGFFHAPKKSIFNAICTWQPAGRIIWASRGNYGGSSSIDQRTKKRFTTIGAILLESGPLYLLTLAVFIVGDLLEAENFDIGSILTQVSGIAPTLMIVRGNINQPKGEEEANHVLSDTRFKSTSRETTSVATDFGAVLNRDEHDLGVAVHRADDDHEDKDSPPRIDV